MRARDLARARAPCACVRALGGIAVGTDVYANSADPTRDILVGPRCAHQTVGDRQSVAPEGLRMPPKITLGGPRRPKESGGRAGGGLKITLGGTRQRKPAQPKAVTQQVRLR
eukprot:COSAG02_NODE_6506_length_3532_cov_2.090009_2_plen_112_part_00